MRPLNISAASVGIGGSLGAVRGLVGTSALINSRGNSELVRRKKQAYQDYIAGSSPDERSTDIYPFVDKSPLYTKYKSASDAASKSAGINPGLGIAASTALGILGASALLPGRNRRNFNKRNLTLSTFKYMS